MTAVLGVHGIKQQQAGRNLLLTTWKPALRDGIERAVGRAGRKEFRPRLDIAFYGDLFLPAGSQGTTATPSSKGADSDSLDVSGEEREFFEEIEAELDLGDVAIEKGREKLPRPLARLVSWMDLSFGAAAAGLFVGELRQVRRYQLDADFAARVRARVTELLDGAEVVVAHSLGTVVAVETLSLDRDHGVRRLVTLGSPLALATVRRRLRVDGEVAPVAAWTNVYDSRDAVSCAGGLGRLWPDVVDVLVDNGPEAHAVERYLSKRETGAGVTGQGGEQA